MNIKEQIKSVGFWAGIVGAVILVLGAFGVEIGDETANAVVNAICSLMVFLGIASAPKVSDGSEAEIVKHDVKTDETEGDGLDDTDGSGADASKS